MSFILKEIRKVTGKDTEKGLGAKPVSMPKNKKIIIIDPITLKPVKSAPPILTKGKFTELNKKVSNTDLLKIFQKNSCPEGQIRSPLSGKCVKPKKCPEGKVLNPKTNRCVKDKTKK